MSDGLRPVYCALLHEARLKTIDHQTYLALREGAEVLEIDHCGEKVLRLKDGSFLKLFRRKRLISSALWYPYAQRFADNAQALKAIGIPVPNVVEVLRVPEIRRDAVRYWPRGGETVRALVRNGLSPELEHSLKKRYAVFVESLFEHGIYFRSLHLGNVVLTTDDQFGLIDIADVRMGRRPLGKYLRSRQLRRMARITEEAGWLPESIL